MDRLSKKYGNRKESLRHLYSFVRPKKVEEGFSDLSLLQEETFKDLEIDREKVLEGVRIAKTLFSPSVFPFVEGVHEYHTREIARREDKHGLEFAHYINLYRNFSDSYEPELIGYFLLNRLVKERGRTWLDQAERKAPWEIAEVGRYLT